MPIRAILFDLDGTLLDTLADIADAANLALEAEGLPTHPLSDYLHYIGDGIAMLLRRALPPDRRDDDALARRCLDRFRSAYEHCWNHRTRPYPGIPELLDALVARGLTLAVLSNKADDFTQFYGEGYLSPWPFRAIVGHRDGVPKKPDPTSALEIAATLGIEPASWALVGDSPGDVRTALAAGMTPIGASWGYKPAEALRESGAGAIIDRPSGLLEVLDGRRGG